MGLRAEGWRGAILNFKLRHYPILARIEALLRKIYGLSKAGVRGGSFSARMRGAL